MSKYYLFYKKNQEKHENLNKIQLVEIVKKYSDYHEWYYWTEGLQNWKLISQSPEVFEWLSFNWSENQNIPKLPSPFESVAFGKAHTTKASDLPENVVEFSDTPSTPTTTENSPLSFSGQVLEFQDSIKEKYLNAKDFKIVDDSPEKNVHPDQFEKTIPGIHMDSERFEKTATNTISSPKVNTENTQTLSNITPGVFDKTAKTNTEPNTTPPVFQEAPKTTDDSVFTQSQEASLSQKQLDKKHNRRYPRINGRLRTIITNKAKAFMTYTKDISLGGIQTENSIPKDIINTEIEVYISDPAGKKSILFRCHPVGDLHNPNRFSFAKADEKNLQKLAQWLEDLEKSQVA